MKSKLLVGTTLGLASLLTLSTLAFCAEDGAALYKKNVLPVTAQAARVSRQ